MREEEKGVGEFNICIRLKDKKQKSRCVCKQNTRKLNIMHNYAYMSTYVSAHVSTYVPGITVPASVYVSPTVPFLPCKYT